MPGPVPGGLPGAPGGEGGAAVGPTDRGYLITLQLTSPNRNAPALVDQMLVKDLLARVSQVNAFKEQKNYYVARAMVVAAQQINSDETRKVKLRTDYDQKKMAQEQANQPAGSSSGYDPAAAFRNRAPVAPRGFGVGRVPDMSGRPRMTRPGGVEDTTTMDQADREAFTDPLYPTELVLDDWQLTVVVAVVLDPKAPPVDPNAAPAQTASAPGEAGGGATVVPTAAEQAAPVGGAAAGEPRSAAPGAGAAVDDRRTASAVAPR